MSMSAAVCAGREKHRLELVGMEVDAPPLHGVLQDDVLLDVAVPASVAIGGELVDLAVRREQRHDRPDALHNVGSLQARS